MLPAPAGQGLLRAQRQLESELMLNVELRAELRESQGGIAAAHAQRTAEARLQQEAAKAEQWARQAAQREAAQLREELQAIQASQAHNRDTAVESLLWLEQQAKAGRQACLELELVRVQLRVSEGRAESVEKELQQASRELDVLRRRGAGVGDAVRPALPARTGGVSEVRGRQSPQPRGTTVEPYSRCGGTTVDQYAHVAVGMRAQMRDEAARLEYRHQEVLDTRRDLRAKQWLASVDRPAVEEARRATVDYAKAVDHLTQIDAERARLGSGLPLTPFRAGEGGLR